MKRWLVFLLTCCAGCIGGGSERASRHTEATGPLQVATSAHRVGMKRYRPAFDQAATPICRTPHLTYYGGPIIQSPVIVPVFWSSHVNAQLTAPTTGMPQFFADITQSTYWSWLQEYDTVGLTNGSEQVVLGATATAGVTLTPSRCASTANCTVSDAQVQTELTAQINAGHLPAPTVDCTGNAQTIYMIEFPPNVKVTGPEGSGTSCVDFCAYHNTGTYGSSQTALIYGVLADEFTGGCASGCGADATPLENSTDTASHELVEAVTDADIGLVPLTSASVVAPGAWYDNNNCGEIADICDDGSAGDTISVNGRSWVVQEVWSNKQGKCASNGTPLPVCSGTTLTNCRRCSCGDDGLACSGGTSTCETTSTNVLFGACEQCTSTNNTCGTGTCTQSATSSQDDICAAACSPLTSCPAGENCGTISDGCGGTVTCGSCTSPQTCGGGGTANVCGAACVPLTNCPSGDDCGTISDGCGGTVTCGSCTSPQTCGGGGTANVCGGGCVPLTSCPAGDDCGTISDGCGGTVDCGSCTSPQTCGGGGTTNTCGCTPFTSCPAGDDCGTISDGCGGTVACGSCTSPQTCGGGGTTNTCSCTPFTSCPAGQNCGTIPDGCGGTLTCGSCSADEVCTNNACVADSSSSSGTTSSDSTASSSGGITSSDSTGSSSSSTGAAAGTTSSDSTASSSGTAGASSSTSSTSSTSGTSSTVGTSSSSSTSTGSVGTSNSVASTGTSTGSSTSEASSSSGSADTSSTGTHGSSSSAGTTGRGVSTGTVGNGSSTGSTGSASGGCGCGSTGGDPLALFGLALSLVQLRRRKAP